MTKDLEKKYQNLNKKRRYELLNYDKKRHLELLNKQGDEFKSKLRTYSIILIDHLNWEIRDQYLELLENYREEKIDSFNFQIRFCERYESIEKVADLLKSNRVLLSPDKNSLNFGDLLSKIFERRVRYFNITLLNYFIILSSSFKPDHFDQILAEGIFIIVRVDFVLF